MKIKTGNKSCRFFIFNPVKEKYLIELANRDFF